MRGAKKFRQCLLICLLAGLSGLTIFAHRTFVTPQPKAQPVATITPTITPTPRRASVAPILAAPLQTGGNFNIAKSVIAGGGARSTGGNFEVTGTAGQKATGQSSGGVFTLASGFWPDAAQQPCPTITVNPDTLPNGTMGVAYTQTFSQTGGTGEVKYSVSAGSLPPGLTLTAGVLSGASSQAGDFKFTIQATDANGCTGTRAYTLTMVIACPAITVNPAVLPAMKVNAAFSQTITATGGAGSYSFAVTNGTLPSGLTLTPQGLLSGTPTQTSSGSFTVTATDANKCSGTRAYSFAVTAACGVITITPATLNNGQVGVPYSRTFTATGGAGGYSFSVKAGSLPVGLTLSAAGVLAGKPEFAGTYPITVQASDTNSCAATQSYSLVIAPRTITTVSAASYFGEQHASEMIVAGFGVDLATQLAVGNTVPLPTNLAGTSVQVRDNAGTTRSAPLFYVSPGQVNFQIPPGTVAGPARVTLTSGANIITEDDLNITSIAPGLFSASATGVGVAAAVALRIKPGNVQSYEPVSQFDGATKSPVPLAIDLGPATEQVYLILFGTGIRGRTALANVSVKFGETAADVLYAGAQGSQIGLDQLNVLIPRSLIGGGEMDVVLTVDGKLANKVKIKIK